MGFDQYLWLKSTFPFLVSQWWTRHLRHKDSGSICASLLHSFGNIAEDGETKMLLTSLLGICSSNNFGAYLWI